MKILRYSGPRSLASDFGLRADEDGIVSPGMGATLLHTGIHIALPDDVSATVSLNSEQRARGLHLDGSSTFLPSGFTGEITLLLITAGPRVVPVKSGQPLARLTPVRVVALHPVRVLAPAARGLGGRLEGV